MECQIMNHEVCSEQIECHRRKAWFGVQRLKPANQDFDAESCRRSKAITYLEGVLGVTKNYAEGRLVWVDKD